jgi:hypothetical protein
VNPFIPSPEVLPLPGPTWLLHFLLLLTFLLHLVPMNLLLGGGILAAVSRILGGRRPFHAHLAETITRLLPLVIAFTVTLGVAPLLFAQGLYGNLFYSSSILIGRAWFFVIPLVIFGYYGSYVLYFRKGNEHGNRTLLSWITALLFVLVAFIYVNNFSLMLRPDRWLDHYFTRPDGALLNWSDPSLFPRFFHMLTGAIAVAGLWIVLLGARGRSGGGEWSGWATLYGAKIFAHATMLNAVVGVWFLLSHPKRVMMIFLGRSPLATGLLALAVLLLLVALVLLWMGMIRKEKRSLLFAGAVLVLPILVLMVAIRDLVRTAYLAPAFRLESLQSAPQWDVFALFAVLLLLAGVIVGILARLALRRE